MDGSGYAPPAGIDRNVRVIECTGYTEFISITNGTDLELLLKPPQGSRVLKRLSAVCSDASGNPVASSWEASWVQTPGILANAADTTVSKSVFVRDRGGFPVLDSWTWAGPSGEGDPIPVSPADNEKLMKLYLFCG